MTIDHLAILRDELDTFHGLLDGDLSVPVEHCGEWTLRDLAEHLGSQNLWAAAAVTELHGDYEEVPAPDDVAGWFAGTARTLTDVLAADPDTPAWTFAPPAATVAFWRRRRCFETLVHRWDAQHALGVGSPLDPEPCADGVAEVLEVFVPRQVRLGRMAELEAAVRLTATDTGSSWVLGPGEPVATVRGTAEELLLGLWNRRALADGDDTARRVLRGPLVP